MVATAGQQAEQQAAQQALQELQELQELHRALQLVTPGITMEQVVDQLQALAAVGAAQPPPS